MRIVDNLMPRTFSAVSHDGGIVLCADDSGAFLVLRFPEELQQLRALLADMEIRTAGSAATPRDGGGDAR